MKLLLLSIICILAFSTCKGQRVTHEVKRDTSIYLQYPEDKSCEHDLLANTMVYSAELRKYMVETICAKCLWYFVTVEHHWKSIERMTEFDKALKKMEPLRKVYSEKYKYKKQ